ncbi:alpha/beta fold hydrolase [Paenibacillus lentus]|uniref:alpha/beta fold hydrolase n=1 Tax=Paenibacillus lentus TaxID=1338368 RepID=UPI0036519B84
MPFLTINHLKTYYEIHPARNKDAETIVMIHGFAMDSSLWQPMLTHLQHRYQIVIYDLRGHGQSEIEDSELGWELMAEDLCELIHHLEIEKFHLVAHGLGAHLAVHFARKHPSYVKSLILLSLPFIHINNYPYQLLIQAFPHIKQAVKTGNTDDLAPFRDLLRLYTSLEEEYHGLVQYFHVLAQLPDHVFAQLSVMTMHSPLLNDLTQISIPTLTIAGDQDAITSYELANMLSFSLEHYTQLVMPNASFLFFLEQPEMTAKWIDYYIQFKLDPRKENQNDVHSKFEMAYRNFFVQHNKYEAAPILEVNLINQFEVSIDGYSIREGLHQRHAKRLLVYLIFHPITTREQICDALFPGVPITRALNNLKVYLNHLNNTIRVPFIPILCLRFHQGNVQLQYKVKCDFIDFLLALRLAYNEKNEEIRFLLSESLLRSVHALLPGMYDDWIIQLRELAEQQLIELNYWMAKRCMERNENLQAVHYWTNVLKYQATNGEAYEEIINLYCAMNLPDEQKRWEERKQAVLEEH